MKNRIALILVLLGTLSLACNIPTQITISTQPETGSEISNLALTVTAQAQLLADINNGTSQENTENSSPPTEQSTASVPTDVIPTVPTASNAPTMVFSPTPVVTSTPDKPTASVSVDTNCRTGPGQVYDIVGALLVGESAEVTGKNTSSNYWIVKNPDNPSKTCWLWGQYASVSGNTVSLAEVSIPATPTPAIPAAPSNLSQSSVCYEFKTQVSSHKSDITLSWQDNSNNEDGFRVYQLTTYVSGSVYYPVGAVGANQTSYSFSAIHYGTANNIKFKIEAFNSAGANMSAEISLDPSGCP